MAVTIAIVIIYCYYYYLLLLYYYYYYYFFFFTIIFIILEVTIGFTRQSDLVTENTPGFITIFAEVQNGQIQGRNVSVSYTTEMSSAANAATSESLEET